jgi:Osmosensitive K+ channel histidine kinase
LRALERGISFQIRDNVKKLPPFLFDRPKIEQVISNLLDNAVKYSHDNRYIQIQGFDDGTRIHIEIWDKGLGIPESEYDNIFKGFRRGSPRDQKRYIPGTGLGLKISKEIVEGHGGQITVKSTPFLNDPRRVSIYEGYDTIFTIILPKMPPMIQEK